MFLPEGFRCPVRRVEGCRRWSPPRSSPRFSRPPCPPSRGPSPLRRLHVGGRRARPFALGRPGLRVPRRDAWDQFCDGAGPVPARAAMRAGSSPRRAGTSRRRSSMTTPGDHGVHRPRPAGRHSAERGRSATPSSSCSRTTRSVTGAPAHRTSRTASGRGEWRSPVQEASPATRPGSGWRSRGSRITTGDPRYLEGGAACRSMASGQHGRHGPGSYGYTGGQLEGRHVTHLKSTEHNSDRGRVLHPTGAAHRRCGVGGSGGRRGGIRRGDAERRRPREHRYRPRRLDDHTRPIPLDAQTLSSLATGDPRYGSALDWTLENLIATDGPYTGPSNQLRSTWSKAWFEGSGHLALAIRLRDGSEDAATAETLLDSNRLAQRDAPNGDGRGSSRPRTTASIRASATSTTRACTPARPRVVPARVGGGQPVRAAGRPGLLRTSRPVRAGRKGLVRTEGGGSAYAATRATAAMALGEEVESVGLRCAWRLRCRGRSRLRWRARGAA